jgi:hypothetical protein
MQPLIIISHICFLLQRKSTSLCSRAADYAFDDICISEEDLNMIQKLESIQITHYHACTMDIELFVICKQNEVLFLLNHLTIVELCIMHLLHQIRMASLQCIAEYTTF